MKKEIKPVPIEMQDLLDIETVSGILGVAKSTVYSWVRLRSIPFVKLGRLVKFSRQDLNDWIESQKVKALIY